MAEAERYRDGGLAVTGLAVEAGDRAWALANVARAYTGRSATGCVGIGQAVMGLIIVILLVASGGESPACYAVGVLLLLTGAVVALAGMGNHDVTLEMVGGKRVKAWSGPEARAAAFAAAINAAKVGLAVAVVQE